MSIDLSKFQDAFFEESGDHVATMEEGLLQLEQRPGDMDLLNRIFRAAHSIKGNAGMFGFHAVGEFTHKMENILDALRNGQMVVAKPLIDLLLEATDALKGLLEAAKSGAPPNESVVGPLRERLAGCADTKGSGFESPITSYPSPITSSSRSSRFDIVWIPGPTVFQRGMDPKAVIGELRTLGELHTTMTGHDRLPPLSELDPERCYLGWRFTLDTDRPRSDIESVFEFVRDDSDLAINEERGTRNDEQDTNQSPSEAQRSSLSAHRSPDDGDASHKRLGELLVEEGVPPKAVAEALASQKRVGEILVEQKVATPQQVSKALEKQHQLDAAAQGKKADQASIRVDIGKIDKLINLVGELVINQSMLSDLANRFDMGQMHVLLERVSQLERTTREIQERVMGVRMLPIGTAFQRFPRLVRDLSAKNGKKIHLVLSGEETELDKTVIESIGDPLTHLVRNSADHGLEPPEDRVAAGKPEQGTIRLNAYHEGGNICITVEDDGRGLNREKILAKALALGLIVESDKLTDEQVWGVIFRPGFSTADRVTDVSGRGVGMDVVKRNIESLGGTVTTRTVPGKGTTFTLKLPLTLAIIEGMTVRVGSEIYIAPLLSILESIQPPGGAVQTVVGKGEVVNVRDAYYPIVRLSDVFGIQPEHTDPCKAILLILETEGERVAVMVDEILGQQQVVIKSLERNFQKVEGFAGATILGDGTVGFILDVRGLIELARRGAPAAV